jgi:predicted TIM-barrel fold metal-dependent hydrolase
VYTRALQIGCTEFYGEWENHARLVQLSGEARRNGLAPLYERVLDLLNCQVFLADVPRLDRTVWSAKRFKWIARFDPFLYPFGPANTNARGTDVATYHARFANKLKLALHEQGLGACPTDFADYLGFVDRVFESFVQRGAVGFKVLSAFVRSLDFQPVPEAEAARVFRDLAKEKKDESRLFEDYMARRLFLWAAKQGLPVQFHVGLGNAEPGMDFNRIGPMMLQSLLMDERYSNLKVVLLHGAYPYCSEASALAWTYGNVYLDFSWMCYLHHHYLIDRLSEWLELLPAHKLLFGCDTGLPETQLGGMRLGVRAIEAALTRGVEAGLWSTSQAYWLGERVCYRNACELYGFSL